MKPVLLVLFVLQDEEAVLLLIKLAQKLGVLSCSECSMALLPALLTADDQALAAVQVRRPHQQCANSVPAAYFGKAVEAVI
jgi:hypothetical protein